MAESINQRERIEAYWKKLTGTKPSAAEYNHFVRVVPYLGGDNPLSPLFVHILRLTHRDLDGIKYELLEDGPSALRQAREIAAEFNEFMALLTKLRSAMVHLTLDYDDITERLKAHEQREAQRAAQRNGQIRRFLSGHHPFMLIAFGIMALIFAQFISLSLLIYVFGSTPNLSGATQQQATQHSAPPSDAPASQMQSGRQSEDDWTPTERSH